ncbi:MAG: glycosyltransferase [Euryarchaeota archaeon]|nr:glycosyltransferase [Euryarchaeota archaeon]
MLISIVITVRNEERYIRYLLDSLLVQEPPFEIIVVDAHSTDRTREIVKEYAEKHDFVHLYEKGGSRGVGRNYGVEKAEGEYVAFTDGDDLVNPFWLKAIRDSFSKGHDVVAGKTIYIGYGPWEKMERVELFYKGMDVTYPSCNLAYRRSLFMEIGGFDTWFVTAEDIDLNIRAVEHGAKFVHNPEAIVYHRTRDSVYSFAKQAFWNGYGRKQLTLKHGKLWGKYKPQNMLNPSQMSFWGTVRLTFAMMGYLACKLYGERK